MRRRIRELFLYGIFGLGATAVNLFVYGLLFNRFHLENLPSNAIAWLAAFVFAFLTNKIFVFESKTWEGFVLLREFAGFFAARAFTGFLDMGLMWFLVDVKSADGMVAKLFVNVLVIILNYLASKLWIFKNSKGESK